MPFNPGFNVIRAGAGLTAARGNGIIVDTLTMNVLMNFNLRKEEGEWILNRATAPRGYGRASTR